jgi:nucleoside 2-deoxyribosyltransferase
MQKVYLAGPTVFLPDADERFVRMKRILSTYGLDGRAPVDKQVGLEKVKRGRRLGEAIYDADESLMDSVDAANLQHRSISQRDRNGRWHSV